MERLLAKGDYFKHTTRSYLTEDEKQQIVGAVERSVSFLGERSSIDRMEYSPLASGREILRSVHNTAVYFGRWVALVKGSTQPRYLYRRRRRCAVECEAQRIADETGADYIEVRNTFLRLMNEYIDPTF